MVIFSILVFIVTIPNEFQRTERYINHSITVNADKDSLFQLMANVEKYPEIFPDNYIAVTILNKTNNVIISNEIVQERGISTEMNVKHTLIPNELHEIEILNGDAKDSKVTISFIGSENKTTLQINSYLNFKGILTPFLYLPESNLIHAINTIITTFSDYEK